MDRHRDYAAVSEQPDQGRSGSVAGLGERQKPVLLAYMDERHLSRPEFEVQLRLLAESAERQGRRLMASAARELLRDWLSRSPDSVPGVGQGSPHRER